MAQLFYFFFKIIQTFVKNGVTPLSKLWRFYNQHLINIEPKLLVIHKPDLSVNHERTDDQNNCYSKLPNYQRLPQCNAFNRTTQPRSEERRVGKECRSRWS